MVRMIMTTHDLCDICHVLPPTCDRDLRLEQTQAINSHIEAVRKGLAGTNVVLREDGTRCSVRLEWNPKP